MHTSVFVLVACLQSAPVDQKRDYRDQLDQLAHTLAKRIETPPVPSCNCDPAIGNYRNDLGLAVSWPRDEFIIPLMAAFGGSDVHAIPIAASGLLNYDDPKLRAFVESYQSDTRESRGGCIVSSVGWEIRGVLKRHAGFAEFKPEVGILLCLGDMDWSPILPKSTVQRAVTALSHQDLSARLKAFCWLLGRGIVLDTSALTEAWPRLTNAERKAMLTSGWRNIRIGESLARTALEQALKTRNAVDVNDEVLGWLLGTLGNLGSSDAHRVAAGIIKKAANAPKSGDTDLLRRAFEAYVATSSREDLEPALAWSRSPHEQRRLAGYAILAKLDDLRAVDAVESYLRKGERSKSRFGLGPWRELMFRPWNDGRIRWRYIRTLTALALDRSAIAQPELWSEGFHVITIIDTLGCIAQADNGPNGFVNPGGFSPDIALETARRWAKWCEVNDPYAAKPGGD